MQQISGAPEQALALIKAGHGAALATVIETWGSAPRRVGAQMVVASDGSMEGSVSGGCVEGAVYELGGDVIRDGEVRYETYGISNDDAFAVVPDTLVGACGTVVDNTLAEDVVIVCP